MSHQVLFFCCMHTAIPNPLISSPTIFELMTQPKDTNPPWFSLTFNVTSAPPTYVTCQKNGSYVEFAALFREVTSSVYQTEGATIVSVVETVVTVFIGTRQPGVYSCAVSVFRSSGDLLNNVTSPEIVTSGYMHTKLDLNG